MIRQIVLAVLISVQVPHLFAEEDITNLQKCALADPSWMSRFGQYIVSTDLGHAYDICRQKAWPNTNVMAVPANCRIEGQRIRAGYYCFNR